MNKCNWIVTVSLMAVCLFLSLDSLSHIPAYHEQHHLFLFSPAYLSAHGATAAGRLGLLADFVIQFFYFRTGGCLLFALLIAALYPLNAVSVYKLTGRRDPLHLTLIPSLYLLVRYTSIDFSIDHLVGLLICSLALLLLSCLRGHVKYYLQPVVLIGLGLFIGWWYPFVAAVMVGASCLSAWLLDRRLAKGKIRLAVGLTALACYAGATFYTFVRAYNMHERISIETESYVKHGEWNKVLSCANRYRGNNQLIDYFRNLALYHTGRLPYELLRYPQSKGVESLYLPWTGENRRSEYGHYIYEQLGLVNEAHHWAFEAMVVNGETAPHLLNLIRYNIANGRLLVARRFIHVLKQSLFYRDQAVTYEGMLTAGDVAGLHALPHRKGEKARFTNVLNLGPELLYVCEREPGNRMAFEYLMSQLLLSNQITRFAANVHRYKAFDYPVLPPMYEEALLVYKLGVDEATFAELGIAVSPETEQRFRAYYNASQRDDTELLRREFGDTYWYYMNYRSVYGTKARND